MFPYEDSKTGSVCLSVCPSVRPSVCLSAPREKNPLSFVNISPTLVIDASHQWKGLHEYYTMETQKFDFFFQKSSKFEFWLLTKSWNHLSFVNISPTLVIDTSMERSSRVLHHGNPKMWNFFKKFEIDEIEFCPYPEFLNAEKRNRPGFVNISPT